MLALCAACGSKAPKTEAPPPPEPKLQLVEEGAPFIVDWDAAQIDALTSAIRGHNVGALVVAKKEGALRLLKDCWLSGVYVPTPMGMYRGMLQVRGGTSRGRVTGVDVHALQQIATSGNVAPGALLDYRVVVTGRVDTSGSRKGAKFWELSERAPGACRGATHFIRAALTGAFERASDPAAPGGVQGGAQGDRMPPRGGDFATCLTSGDAKSPACSAFLKIELSALQTARVELRLVSFALGGQSAANIQFVFRGKDDYRAGTTAYSTASATASWLLPPAEITEDSPLIVEAVQQTERGALVLASGQISPSDVRKGVFDIELRNPTTGAKVGTIQLAASEAAAAP